MLNKIVTCHTEFEKFSIMEDLLESDPDNYSGYSTSDSDIQPVLKLNSFAKKIPVSKKNIPSKTQCNKSQPTGELLVSSAEAASCSSTNAPTTVVVYEAEPVDQEHTSATASDDEQLPGVIEHPKKRKRNPSKRQNDKEKRLRSHISGPPCGCTLLKCFEAVTEEERVNLLMTFNNDFDSVNEQNAYLFTMIFAAPKARSRSQLSSSKRVFSYEYVIPVLRNAITIRIKVCHKAFLSVFGITNRRTQTIKFALGTRGKPPKDGRGKHGNVAHALPESAKEAVRKHVGSIKGRKSHYSRETTQRIYLPSELNVTKLYNMFKDKEPDIKLSYESYRTIFNTEFNIAFGYPRSDTCSTCDSLIAKLSFTQSELSEDFEESKEKVRRINSEKDNNKDDSTNKKAIVTKTADDSDKKNDASNEEKTSESEKTKEDRADELALHDEFVLMDEVGYEGEQKKSEDNSSKKEEGKDQNSGKHDLGMDLERPDLDLEDVNVDMSQDEVGTIEMGNDEEMDIGEETADDSTDKKVETIDTEKETELEKTDVDVAENDLNNETTQVAEERPAEEDAENTGMAKDSILTSDILEEIDVKKEATAVEKDEGVTLTPEVKVENEPLESEDPSTEVKTTSSDDTEIKDTTVEAKADVEDSYIELGDSILEGSQNESQITEYDSEVSGDESKIIQDESKMAEDESTNIFQLFDDIATPKQVQEKILEGSQEQFDAGSSRPESEEEFGNVEESKVGELQSVVKDTLKEVVTAKEHLLAFTKATKNKAALAIAKKLKVCLEVAITRLESADSI